MNRFARPSIALLSLALFLGVAAFDAAAETCGRIAVFCDGSSCGATIRNCDSDKPGDCACSGLCIPIVLCDNEAV